MLASEVEARKVRILESIAAEGLGCEPALVSHFRYDPGDQNNPAMRAAIAEMVFEQVGSFARQMMVRVVGESGNLDDANYLSVLLDSSERPNFRYPFKKDGAYGGRAHSCDSDEKVREAAIDSIGRILLRGAEIKSAAPVNGKLGRAVLVCALLDGSERIRGAASEILWNYADKAVLLMLLKEFSDAEKSGNLHIYARAEDAVKRAAEAMGKARVRGTALSPLIDFAVEDGKAGMVCSDLVVRLAGMEAEAVNWLVKKRAAIGTGNGSGEEEKGRRVRRLTSLIDRIGLVSGEDGKPLPRQLKEAPGEKPTRNMRIMTVLAEKGEAPLHVPGDWIGNWFRRRAHKKERQTMERMRAQERAGRAEGKNKIKG